MDTSLVLLLVGVIVVVIALFAGKLSPALAAKKWWILGAGAALLVLGIMLDPDFARGVQDGLRGS